MQQHTDSTEKNKYSILSKMITALRHVFGIFVVRKEERWMALVMLLLQVAMHTLVICKYFDKFSLFSKHYFNLFIKTFHVSGYDPITYDVVSEWGTTYNIYRHPLLAFFMYLPNQINQALMMLTGMNCVQFVVASVLLFCAFYSFLFLYRIFSEVIELQHIDAVLLSFLTFSFAYVLVASVMPDHFVMSMFMLVLTLYVCGKKMKRHLPLTRWQTFLFFLVTAGISLSNGVKVFLAALFTNQRRFFHPLNIFLVVILPSLFIWMFARYEYSHFEYPRWHEHQVMKQKFEKRQEAKVIKKFRDTTSLKDSAQIAAGIQRMLRLRALEAYQKKQRDPNKTHQGTPIAKGEFSSWTDISTSRIETTIENLFGESLMLHQDHLLGDTLRGRPVIVSYRWWINYVVEAVFVLMLLGGLWAGRRNRFMWMAVSFFAFDMLLHMGLGFGINEIYIMSPHWAFVYTIVIGQLFRVLTGRSLVTLRAVALVMAAYMYIYNVTLITQYLI